MIRYPKKTVAIATIVLLFLVQPAGAQERPVPAQIAVSLDTVTKLFSILGTVLALCVGVLQLYVTNRINKVESHFKERLIEMEFKYANRVDLRIEKLENKMASKEDIANIREIVKMGLANMEMQIKNSNAK